MAVSGRLSNFSLPEVLQFAQEGNRTGLLTVRSLPASSSRNYFIWLNQGRIVAASDRNDYHGLTRLIAQREWIETEQLMRLVRQCPLHTPFGMYLKAQGFLTVEQLKVLFSVQIIREVCALFELEDGLFNFTSNAQLPYLDMIGTSIPATNVTLPGLRNLKNWSALTNKLPNLTSGLLTTTEEKPEAHLTRQEWKIWGLADGMLTLTGIAKRLELPIEEVQRTAFRLSVVGLIEEVPLADLAPTLQEDTATVEVPSHTLPSPEFLSQMVSFLQKL